MLTSEQKVVVCRTDKDGKILIVNYSDYHEIMEKELNKFDVLQFTPQIMHKQFEVNKRKCENLIISLFEKGVISKDLLYHSTGYRVKENCYQKVTGELAKYFACSSPAYAYPLFKTNKLQPDHLLNARITDITVRLLQSAGHIPTSRFTAMIEYILHPIAVKYCQDGINEYCRDGTHYLLELDQWKSNKLNIQNKLINEDLFIVAADVIALYPNINRNTLRDALTTALNLQSQFCALGQRYFVELIMLILESVIIQHGQHFYKQSNGIITGDNHSVSLANIAMHFATTPAFPILKKVVIYKRFIDDITFIAIGENSRQNIIKAIENSLGKVGLQITTKLFNTKCSDQQVEFFDVLHKHSSDSPFKFVTSNYVKKTALDRTFINGASYHPLWVFQSIAVSEAMRMRRICEDKTDYDTNLEYLKNKCFKSKVPKTLTSKIIEQAKSWVDRFHPINNSKLKKNKPKKIVWVTQFPKLLRSSQMEKRLQSNVMLAYKRPQTLDNFVARYKKLSFGPLEGKDGGISGPCGKCAL